MNMAPDRRLLVFARYPRPGEVKTRLSPALTPEEGAELYEAFLCDSLAGFLAIEDRFDLFLYVADPADTGRLADFLAERGIDPDRKRITLRGQSDGTLGDRLESAFDEAFGEGCSAVCAVGTDHPTLPQVFLRDAFLALEVHDVVIGPATDGGYYLIGMNRLHREMFRSMTWSRSDLFRQTLQQTKRGGLSVALLPEWYDVDDPASLARLAAERDLAEAAPRTARVIGRLSPDVTINPERG